MPFYARSQKAIESSSHGGRFPAMKTLTVDDDQRIRLPDAAPQSVFAYEEESSGVIRLTPVRAEAEEPFPRGSLLEYLTPEHDHEQLAILKGSVQGPA